MKTEAEIRGDATPNRWMPGTTGSWKPQEGSASIGPPDTLVLAFWPPHCERINICCFKPPPFVLTFITAPRMNVLPPTPQNTENCKHLINECVAATAPNRPCSMLSTALRAAWLHVTLPSIPPAFPCWHLLSTAQEQNSERGRSSSRSRGRMSVHLKAGLSPKPHRHPCPGARHPC